MGDGIQEGRLNSKHICGSMRGGSNIIPLSVGRLGWDELLRWASHVTAIPTSELGGSGPYKTRGLSYFIASTGHEKSDSDLIAGNTVSLINVRHESQETGGRKNTKKKIKSQHTRKIISAPWEKEENNCLIMAFMMTRRKGKDGNTEEFSPRRQKKEIFSCFFQTEGKLWG